MRRADTDLRTMADIVRVQRRERPDKVALRFLGRATTYRDLDDSNRPSPVTRPSPTSR